MKQEEKHIWEVTLKGDFPIYRNEYLFKKPYSDITMAYGKVRINATESEFREIIDELFPDDKVKIIGIENLSDTLIEVKEAINDDGTPSDKMLIIDLENKHNGYYLSKTDIESLLEDDSSKQRLYSDNYGYPVRFYVKKKELQQLISK
jgi:hypothetical protein